MRNAVINLLALLLVIVVNALANILPINDKTTGEISNQLDVLFTPAGYVFSIWGVIYFLLAIWVIIGFTSNRKDSALYNAVSPWFWLSCLLNVSWLLSWHYEFTAISIVIMLGLLLTLIKIYETAKRLHQTFYDRLPFSVYLGWISVATIANISYYLVKIDWNGFGISQVAWTIIMLFVAILLGVIFVLKEKDLVFPLVIIWALIGVGIRNMPETTSVSYTAYGLSVFLALVILIFGFKKVFTRP